MSMPSFARAIAGFNRSASVNLPEPYLSSATARPATVAGTPMPSAEGRAISQYRACRQRPEKSPAWSPRCGLAVIDGDVFVAILRMDHHETAAADVSRARIGPRPIAKPVATAASTALPPCFSTSAPICAAIFSMRNHHAVFGGGRHESNRRRGALVKGAALLLCACRQAARQISATIANIRCGLTARKVIKKSAS